MKAYVSRNSHQGETYAASPGCSGGRHCRWYLCTQHLNKVRHFHPGHSAHDVGVSSVAVRLCLTATSDIKDVYKILQIKINTTEYKIYVPILNIWDESTRFFQNQSSRKPPIVLVLFLGCPEWSIGQSLGNHDNQSLQYPVCINPEGQLCCKHELLEDHCAKTKNIHIFYQLKY